MKRIRLESVIINPDTIVFPDWAKQLVVAWCEDWVDGGNMEPLYVFEKHQDQPWEPYEGEYVWGFRYENSIKEIIRYPHPFFHTFARINNLHKEVTWTWEQFMKRGDTYEVDEK